MHERDAAAEWHRDLPLQRHRGIRPLSCGASATTSSPRSVPTTVGSCATRCGTRRTRESTQPATDSSSPSTAPEAPSALPSPLGFALAGFTWPADAEVRVRMGLHTAEPHVADDGYVGIGVHRAARICDAARGGQILVSNATAGIIEDAESGRRRVARPRRAPAQGASPGAASLPVGVADAAVGIRSASDCRG